MNLVFKGFIIYRNLSHASILHLSLILWKDESVSVLSYMIWEFMAKSDELGDEQRHGGTLKL